MGGWSRALTGLITLAVMAFGAIYIFNLVHPENLKGDDLRLILRFTDAHGVPVGGAVRHKGVRVGEVLKVDIAPDDSSVIMELAVMPKFHHTLRESSRFWIVRPYFGGIAEGASGLDTLIKDPYVEYDTPDLGTRLLPTGSLIFGLNLPPVAEDEDLSPQSASRRDRLLFKVRFSHADGLHEGAPVMYRDVPVGTVLDVDLSLDGRSVEADVLIHNRYRETARTDSVFWIAKPNVEFGFHWPSFMNVKDLSKIISGTALSYATPTESTGRPLKKGDVLLGTEGEPKERDEFEGPLVAIDPAKGLGPTAALGLETVGVSIAFTEDNLISDDAFFFQGTGFLFKGADGKTRVLTARTLADGTYSSKDMMSGADIKETNIKVLFHDRSTHNASLAWIDPAGRDLAVLNLDDGGEIDFEGLPPLAAEGPAPEYYQLLSFRDGEDETVRSQPIPREMVTDQGSGVFHFLPTLKLNVSEWWGALLLDGEGRIKGMVGRREALADEPALAVIQALPEVEQPEQEPPQ